MKKTFQLLFAIGLPGLALAQEATATTATAQNSSLDLVWWMMIGTMIILLVAILLLGNVLIKLTQIVADKKSKIVATLLLLLGTSFAFSQDPANAANFPVAEVVSKPSTLELNLNYILASIVLLAEFTVVILFLLNIRSLLNQISDKKEEPKQRVFHMPKFLDNINASVPLEREKDVLLDHNYDGIQELDNNLPPWWKYGFYLTIIWAIGYLTYFTLMGGPSQLDEYNAAMKIAAEEQEIIARNNKNKVDENSVKLADALGLQDGESIFATNCATCHGKEAEGGAGPNLTDDYWLHGGGLNHIYKSIKYGWSAKGMKSWEKDLSPVQIQNVASYIASLHGTKPANAKAPEGELYQEEGTKTDKVVATVDTLSAK